MFSSSRWRCLLSTLLAACLPVQSGIAADSGLSWPGESVTFYTTNLVGADNLWKDTFDEAARRWNDTPARFEFITSRAPASGYCSNLGDNNVRFASTHCGDAWGSSALGITSFWSNGGELTKTDISFNNSKTWNVYDGPVQAFATDFRRVAMHELGHAVGLAHAVPDNVLMSASTNNSYLPAFDDVASLNAKYGTKTYTLTIEIRGAGVVDVAPAVAGTGIVYNNTFYNANYGDFLNCRSTICQIPVQQGLRLRLDARALDAAVFVHWQDSLVTAEEITLAPMTADLTLIANFTNSDGSAVITFAAGPVSGTGSLSIPLLFSLLLLSLRAFIRRAQKSFIYAGIRRFYMG